MINKIKLKMLKKYYNYLFIRLGIGDWAQSQSPIYIINNN